MNVGAAAIKVLIVDDQPVVRAGVARILSPADGFEIVGECTDGDEVFATVARTDPDLVLMDIRMARVDGVAATLELSRRHHGPPPVLILTTFDDDDALWAAIQAGAGGFILKDSPAENLIAAVRAVAHGATWLDPKVTPRVMEVLRAEGRQRPSLTGRSAELTDREREVLQLMARGATNREIASELILSEATIKSHIGSIFSKLAARDRAAAIIYAYDHGIVTPGRGDIDSG